MWEPYKKGFKAYLQLEKSLSDNSVQAYLRDIEHFTQFLLGKNSLLTPSAIKLKELQQFLKWIGELGPGTVVGVASNVFGGGFPPKHIPCFSWGGADGLVEHALDKALHTAQRVMERRSMPLDAADRAVLAHVHAVTAGDRA